MAWTSDDVADAAVIYSAARRIIARHRRDVSTQDILLEQHLEHDLKSIEKDLEGRS